MVDVVDPKTGEIRTAEKEVDLSVRVLPKKNSYRQKPVVAVRDRSAYLTATGQEIIDPTPVATELAGMRLMTIEERMALFENNRQLSRHLIFDETVPLDPKTGQPDFDDPSLDDYGDELDDVEPISPYEFSEIAARTKQVREAMSRKKENLDPEISTDDVDDSDEVDQVNEDIILTTKSNRSVSGSGVEPQKKEGEKPSKK